jgi:streptogramin lyase
MKDTIKYMLAASALALVAACGGGGDAPSTPSGVVTTLAGTPGATGSTDGTGAAALFDLPHAVAVDSSGNVYVADTGNSTIRKITPAGVVTTFAGTARQSGSADGTGAAASFGFHMGVAVDSSGNVYVSDAANCVIRKITPAGVVTTLAGTAGQSGSTDGTGADARFKGPVGVAVDSSGNVYVADTSNLTIRKITPAGVVTTLAGTAGQSGSADGTGAAASFAFPMGVAVDSSGNVYVADFDAATIRKITPDGVVTTFAGGPENRTPGDGVGVGIPIPSGIAVGADGYIYFVTEANTVGKIKP